MKKNGLSKKEKICKKRWLRDKCLVDILIDYYFKEEYNDEIGNIVWRYYIFAKEKPITISKQAYGIDGYGEIYDIALRDKEFVILSIQIDDNGCSLEHNQYEYGLLKHRQYEKHDLIVKPDPDGGIIKDEKYITEWAEARNSLCKTFEEYVEKYTSEGYDMYTCDISHSDAYSRTTEEWRYKYILKNPNNIHYV